MYHPDYSLSATTPTPWATPPLSLPPPSTGADFTDAWVSQAATATATGAVLSPHQDWDDGGRPHSGMSGGRYDDDDDVDEEEAEYLDQETVDEFDDKVLNKIAAKVKIALLIIEFSVFMNKSYFSFISVWGNCLKRTSLSYKDQKKEDTKKDAA